MRVIETFVTSVPREEIPGDAKWFMQDGESGLLKFSVDRKKPDRSPIRDMWVRDGYLDSSEDCFVGISIPLSTDAELKILSREELMRAYDLVDQGYTLWFGGKCPVSNNEEKVDYVCENGFEGEGLSAGLLAWNTTGIIAYRLSQCGGEVVNEGAKDDSQKQRFSLVPTKALTDVIDVLEFGAKKYGSENWRKVDNAQERYFNAAMRHLLAWRKGESSDDESGLPHLAHAATCLMFMIEGDKK